MAVWASSGWSGWVAYMPGLMGRPLHLLWAFTGMALTGGSALGMYLMLSLVVLSGFFLLVWGLKPIIASAKIRWVLALMFGLHPWWSSGDLLRFLPAQVAVTMTIVWFVCGVRFLTSRRRLWVLPMILATIVGLLTYQAPTVVIAIVAVLLFFILPTGASRARRATGFALTLVSLAAMAAYTMVIAPMLSSVTYESEGIPENYSVLHAIKLMVKTDLSQGQVIIVFAAVVAVAVAVCALRGFVSWLRALWLVAAICVSPLAALPYMFSYGHMTDIERVGLPFGLTVFLVLVCLVACIGSEGLARFSPATVPVWLAVAVTLSISVAWVDYQPYHKDSNAEEQLLEKTGQELKTMDVGDNQIVLADHSGVYGDLYTFYPGTLNNALYAEDDISLANQIQICTVDSVTRHQPYAERGQAPVPAPCSAVIPPGSVSITSFGLPEGQVDMYVLPKR